MTYIIGIADHVKIRLRQRVDPIMMHHNFEISRFVSMSIRIVNPNDLFVTCNSDTNSMVGNPDCNSIEGNSDCNFNFALSLSRMLTNTIHVRLQLCRGRVGKGVGHLDHV